jgi:Ca2+-binding EF-hand superfamily protein
VKSVKTIETPEEKLNWIFTAFDEDGGGSIDVEEIREIVLGCFRMAGLEEDDELLPSCVEDVRMSIDIDGDGDISKDEFVKNALNNKFISRLLKYKA